MSKKKKKMKWNGNRYGIWRQKWKAGARVLIDDARDRIDPSNIQVKILSSSSSRILRDQKPISPIYEERIVDEKKSYWKLFSHAILIHIPKGITKIGTKILLFSEWIASIVVYFQSKLEQLTTCEFVVLAEFSR